MKTGKGGMISSKYHQKLQLLQTASLISFMFAFHAIISVETFNK